MAHVYQTLAEIERNTPDEMDKVVINTLSERSPLLRRLPWSDLLQRVFAVDALACPRCGERLRLLAAIESPEAIRAILDCLGLPSRAPPLAPSEPEATALELGFEELPTFET